MNIRLKFWGALIILACVSYGKGAPEDIARFKEHCDAFKRHKVTGSALKRDNTPPSIKEYWLRLAQENYARTQQQGESIKNGTVGQVGEDLNHLTLE